ncbi:hypothetical protein BDF20DRAFT_829651 [Mycotypha africana]|uniref:uncharacterized protein n=1 Tax=Mycotypha africana TaxID=64632 RepID=UPI0022FFD3DB|nr:uncharacterized protein BDF20DRAFT_829651 [Mycotypha africana]KAI8967363.1 hypothetical protein BDF20DRAFT_829651 [Mycotypha africana]
MYRLSELPMEILYTIMECLSTEDILMMARLNTWYGYHLSWILSERIERHVRQDGWRIHIDILAKTHIQKTVATNDNRLKLTPPFTEELLLLSEYSGVINPYTLTLEFNLYPVDENGLDTVLHSKQIERSNVKRMFRLKTNIDIVAYFAQISTNNRRLQHVNQAGAAAIAMKEKQKGKKKIHPSSHNCLVARMGKGFNIQYKMFNMRDINSNEDMSNLAGRFRNDFEQSRIEHVGMTDRYIDSIAVITFDKLHVSPEWWVNQMKMPTLNSNSSDLNSCGFSSGFF